MLNIASLIPVAAVVVHSLDFAARRLDYRIRRDMDFGFRVSGEWAMGNPYIDWSGVRNDPWDGDERYLYTNVAYTFELLFLHVVGTVDIGRDVSGPTLNPPPA